MENLAVWCRGELWVPTYMVENWRVLWRIGCLNWRIGGFVENFGENGGKKPD